MVSTALIRLDIGCGSHKAPGWTGLDNVSLPGVDIVHDLLTFPWPLADESVAEARCEHFIEHIPHACRCCVGAKDPFFAFFDEAYRVLAPGGIMHLICPHSDSRRAWSDPTHTRGINEMTLFYLNRDSRVARGVGHYDVSCHFDAQYKFIFSPDGFIQDLHATLVKLP